MNKRWILLLILTAALAVTLAACGGNESGGTGEVTLESESRTVDVGGGASYTAVSVDGLALMLEDKDFPLINVHIPYEGELENTDAFIPYNEITQHLDQLPADKDARIVLYCRSGNMSAQAARELAQLGYTDVWDVEGGFVEWERSGRTVEGR